MTTLSSLMKNMYAERLLDFEQVGAVRPVVSARYSKEFVEDKSTLCSLASFFPIANRSRANCSRAVCAPTCTHLLIH